MFGRRSTDADGLQERTDDRDPFRNILYSMMAGAVFVHAFLFGKRWKEGMSDEESCSDHGQR